MNREDERLSRYLDGEIERKDLPESLRRQAEAFERLIGALDRRPVTLPPNVRSDVIARVHAASRSPWRRAWTWLAVPRTISGKGRELLLAVLAIVRPSRDRRIVQRRVLPNRRGGLDRRVADRRARGARRS